MVPVHYCNACMKATFGCMDSGAGELQIFYSISAFLSKAIVKATETKKGQKRSSHLILSEHVCIVLRPQTMNFYGPATFIAVTVSSFDEKMADL